MSDNATQPISPELALVDPDLRAAARALLPEPADCLAVRPRAPRPLPQPQAAVAPARDTSEARRLRGPRRVLRGAVTAAAWVVLAGIVASPLLAFLPPSRAPSIVDAPSAEPPPPATPNGGTRTVTGSTIRWHAVPGASQYNLILVRGSRRVDFWPTKPIARVTRAPRAGEAGMPVVTYSWFVYPVFRSSSGKVRYGKVVDHGAIAVRPGTLRAGT